MENIDFSEIGSFKDLKKLSPNTDSNEKTANESPVKLKRKADKAFGQGKFTKAYTYYNQLLLVCPNDYDILACQIGTALNLGYLDEVFTKSEILIGLDEKKAQGYYLKGIANDILFNFEKAADLFLKALEHEKSHSKLIVKNLTKTIAKYLNVSDLFQLEDNDDEPEATYLLKLIEVTEYVIKKRKLRLAIKILNYIESLDTKNYLVKTEFLLTSGNLFKFTQTFDKAFLALEECLYLASLNSDFKLKIKALLSISACYLLTSDLHKVIYYYHKILDIETDLLHKTSEDRRTLTNINILQFSDEVINLELRIAIRQNLFTAHYRLGKLRLCCYYLNEMIMIIDSQLDLSNPEKVISIDLLAGVFDYVQIKLDASIELCKFHVMFKEFIHLEKLLNSMLVFVKNLIEKLQLDESQLRQKPYSNLKLFKIRCYSFMGICQAGLREFRFSKLCTRKSLQLVENEIRASIDENASVSVSDSRRGLTSLKIDCLLNAAEASNQVIQTFTEMKETDFRLLSEMAGIDSYSKIEVDTVLEAYDQRISLAKEAFMLSKSLFDPNLRVKVTFEFAMSLYANNLYQSAAYYFNEILSISTLLLDSMKPIEETSDFLTDIKTDYHLESSVYFMKCQLLIDFFQSESCICEKDVTSETEASCNPDPESKSEQTQKLATDEDKPQLERFYEKLVRTNELICTCILKWKITETNRGSFKFNMAEKEKLKVDNDCERLRKILEICTECLVYVAFKLKKYDTCLFYIEHNNYLLSLDTHDLKKRLVMGQNSEDLVKLIESKNLNLVENIDEMRRIQQKINSPLVVYKFAFDANILFVFYVEPNGLISHAEQVKLSLVFNRSKISVDSVQKKLNGNSELQYFKRKFDKCQNEWVMQNLSEIECRDVSSSNIEIRNLRTATRCKEKRLHDHFDKMTTDSKDLCKELVENSINRDKQLIAEATSGDTSEDSNNAQETEHMVRNVLYPVFFGSIAKKLKENTQLMVNILVDSAYVKLLVLTLNDYNMREDMKASKIFYNIILDSFLLPAVSVLTGDIKEKKELNSIQQACQNIKYPPLQTNNTSTSDKQEKVKILKSDILPRHTSHPRLAVQLLNEDPSADYITVRNDHVKRVKTRLDASVGTLISNTFSNTDAKHSNLQVLPYKQIYKQEKCCAIGCSDLPKAFFSKSGVEKFLKNGFDQLCRIGKILHANPVFSAQVTKQELLNQLESSKVLFLSIVSSNESSSSLICAETKEYPSCVYEVDKYCRLGTGDLNLISMENCHLLILNCYSSIGHVARLQLANKFLARGCRNLIVVMSPLTDELMTQFYCSLFEGLKEEENVSKVYYRALSEIIQIVKNKSMLDDRSNSQFYLANKINMIKSAFCLLGSKHIRLSINQIAKSMVQASIDSALCTLQSEKNYLNVDQPLSILSGNFKPWLEKTLIDLQILFKFTFNQLITLTDAQNPFKTNENLKSVLYYLYDLVTKSIYFMKNRQIEPEQLSELVINNKNAENILISLGFNTQRTTVSYIRDTPEKKFIAFPDNRFLDLNMRAIHILSALIELCFEQSIESQAKQSANDYSINLNEASYINQFYDKSMPDEKLENRIKSIVFNLQALLPVENKNLLTALIDIIALTKFSSEIILALTDHSVYYAFNYYENANSKDSSKEFVSLLNKDVENWCRPNMPEEPMKSQPNFSLTPGVNHAVNFSRTNKVVNFLFSIGFEIVGNWLRFNDTEFNRRIIEIMLKFFTSFAVDRDMTLYKELNINVMGQRSAVTRDRYSMIRTQSAIASQADQKKVDYFKTLVPKPWAVITESSKEMAVKLNFVKSFVDLSKKLSSQRSYALKHYLNYTVKQHEMNLTMNQQQEAAEANKSTKTRVKFKSGGGPARDRIIVNEKLELSHDQINQIRKLSFLFCQKSILQVDIDMKEKTQKLMLPLIKTKIHNL